MKFVEYLMSNSRDKRIAIKCPECKVEMEIFRIVKQLKPFHIYIEYECSICHRNEEIDIMDLIGKSFKFTDAESEILLNQMLCLQNQTKRNKGWLPSFKRQVNSIVKKLQGN